MSSPNPGNRFSLSEPILQVPRHDGSILGERMQAKYGASVLARKADLDGWTEDELTIALNDYAIKIPDETKSTPVVPYESSKKIGGSERGMLLQKRQETLRIIRQAEMEGWSDEKLVAALRLRNSIHYELRNKVSSIERT